MKRIVSLLFLLLMIAVFPVMEAEAYMDGPTSGVCGDHTTWSYDAETGYLTFSGTGAMYDYEAMEVPWYKCGGRNITVVIEEGVTYVGDYAFYNMWDVYTASFPATLTEIGDHVFERTNLKSFELPYGLVVIGESAFQGLSYVENLVIPDSVEVIKDYAFEGTYRAKTIKISKGLKSVGKEAFGRCNAVEKLSFPNSITQIPDGLCSGNAALRQVILPSQASSVGEEAFAYCHNLKTVRIPDGVESIGMNAFRGCVNLDTVYIPATVKTIDFGAFYACDKLKTVIYEGTPESWKTIAMGEDNERLLNAQIQYGKNPFVDVGRDQYFYEAIIWARENGVTGGTSLNTFSPYATCTRAQVVSFLWRAYGFVEPESFFKPFNDVSYSSYYSEPMLWATERGITGGTSPTTFSPNAPCTRAQVVTFLWRAEGCPKVNANNPFEDVSADAYYYDAVLWAVEQGVTSGTSPTTFSPNGSCTRGQIVTFLYRFFV